MRGDIYRGEKKKKEGGGFFFEKKHALEALENEGRKARSNEKRVIAAKDCPGMPLVTLNVPIPIRFLHLVVFSF